MQDTFMCRYIFPDSRFWHELELLKFQDDLKVRQHWFLNGRNYQRTLQAWLDNFRNNWEQIRAVRGDGDQFFRIWNYYLRFTQALFRGQRGTQVGNGQYLLWPA
jgi:cyclopropane-fatty-acyl-phospholipid synthase